MSRTTIANLIAASNWRTPENHPDLNPRHEALLLREQFTELLRTPEVWERPDEFRQMLRGSELSAMRIEELLTRWRPKSDRESIPPAIAREARRIAADCKACRAKFRDVPADER